MESLSEIILFMENQLSIMSSSVHEDCLFLLINEISKLKVIFFNVKSVKFHEIIFFSVDKGRKILMWKFLQFDSL